MENKKEETLKSQESPKVAIVPLKEGQRRIRIQFDLTYNGHPGKEVKGESKTEPDMTLSLGTLLERHTRGKDIPVNEPLYFETQVPTFSDLTDIERYREQLEARLEETNAFIKAEAEELKAQKEAKEKAKKANEVIPAVTSEAEDAKKKTSEAK